MPTQQQFNTSNQASREIDIRVFLLNYQFQMVDELSGVIIGTPSFNISATSDIRRTCSISLIPIDPSFDIKEGNKIWVDKYLKIQTAITDIKTGEQVWVNQGIYLINEPSRAYSATSNILSIEGIDLMSKLTGLRNGELEGIPHIIEANENIRSAIISTLALAGFHNYVVEECPISNPNEIKIDIGGTVYDILSALRDVLPQYQIYFDVDGVFHYNMIPSGKNAQILVDDTTWSNLLLDYSIGTDFENVKNSITVIGKTHDISYYSATTTISGSTYNATIAEVSSIWDGLKIGFTAPSKQTNPSLNLNGWGAIPIYTEGGVYPILENEANVYYVVKYIASGGCWLFMGTVTPRATIEETNPDSPFYINGTMGRIRKTFSGGSYDNIYTNDLALQRAKWELYNYCRIQDNVTLNCLPIYWLDVNIVIEITLPNKQGAQEKNKYIIKEISTTFGGTQSINAMKYYPYHDTE